MTVYIPFHDSFSLILPISSFHRAFPLQHGMEVQNPDGCAQKWWNPSNDGVRIAIGDWEKLVKDDGGFEILTGLKEEEGKIETEKWPMAAT